MTIERKLYTREGVLDRQSIAAMDQLLARLDAAAKPKLLLFVHGGLVPQKQGECSAEYLDASQSFRNLHAAEWEPAYLIWRTGLEDVFLPTHERLAKNGLFRRSAERLLKWAGRHVSGVALPDGDRKLEALMDTADAQPVRRPEAILASLPKGEQPMVENAAGLGEHHLAATELAQELIDDPLFIEAAESEANAADPLIDPELAERIAAERALAGFAPAPQRAALGPAGYPTMLLVVAAGFRVIKRFAEERDHGLGPTVVEELCRAFFLGAVGAFAWEKMKGFARAHFEPAGGATRLLRGLDRIGARKPVRVLLIGHSAGSIVAAHWARSLGALGPDVTTDFALLAPAIRVTEATQLFVHSDARVGAFRSFTMEDALERANHLDTNPFGRIYHRSLLYLIAGVLERDNGRGYPDAPLLGLQRHMERQVPLTKAERTALAGLDPLFDGRSDPLVYAERKAPSGRATTSHRHGGYYEDGLTLQSIEHIAAKGGT